MVENKKSKLWLGFLVGVFVSLILGVGIFAVYNNILLKTNNGDNLDLESGEINNNDNSSDSVIQTLSIYDTVGRSLYESVSFPICMKDKDKYYRQDKFLASDLTDIEKIYFAVKNAEYLDYCSKELAMKKFNELFGSESIFPEVMVTETNNDLMVAQNDMGYYTLGDTCVTDISKEIIKIEKNTIKDEYYIYDVVMFLDYNDSTDRADIYADYQKNNLIESSAIINQDGWQPTYVNLQNVVDKLDTYKYTFKSNGDSTYYFYSVERQ